MRVLVCGGAGYIGSHTVKELAREGFEPVVLDNFSSGHRELARGEVITADLRNRAALREVFASRAFEAVLHFASLIQVGESYLEPLRYYTHNLTTSLNLIEAMLEAGVKTIIFSSSAAVYGVPDFVPITEDHPLRPANPYGRSKLMIEQFLEDSAKAHGLRFISLRYFNAAGADPEGEIGEWHDPESHLIPNLLLFLLGKKDAFELYGTDFPTPDGTAIRDYVHVTDLAVAHVLALKRLLQTGESGAINLGTNRGFSVREVIRVVEKVTGRQVDFRPRPRRVGDVPILLASKERAERVLGWQPRHSALEEIVATAWRWHSRGPAEETPRR